MKFTYDDTPDVTPKPIAFSANGRRWGISAACRQVDNAGRTTHWRNLFAWEQCWIYVTNASVLVADVYDDARTIKILREIAAGT